MKFVKNMAVMGLGWGGLMFLFMGLSFEYSWFLFFLAMAGGALFGLLTSMFVDYQRGRMESTSGLFENEEIVFQGPASHCLKGETRGGWLTVTPTRLAFRSHGSNIRNRPLDLRRDEISSVQPGLTFGLIPNGMRVLRSNGGVERFIVSNRREWIKVITESVGAEQNAQPTRETRAAERQH